MTKLEPNYKFTTLTDLQHNAVRTESLPPRLKFNQSTMTELFDLIICVGNILDQFKKNLFYGNAFDDPGKYPLTLEELTESAIKSLVELQEQFQKGTHLQQDSSVEDEKLVRSLHATMGISTEGTELFECMRSCIVDKTSTFDIVNFFEELGDAAYYTFIGSDIDKDDDRLQTVIETVINKLRVRFPDKSFASHHAQNRNLDNERGVLEQGFESK